MKRGRIARYDMDVAHIDPNLIGPYLVTGPALIGPETRTEALPLCESLLPCWRSHL